MADCRFVEFRSKVLKNPTRDESRYGENLAGFDDVRPGFIGRCVFGNVGCFVNCLNMKRQCQFVVVVHKLRQDVLRGVEGCKTHPDGGVVEHCPLLQAACIAQAISDIGQANFALASASSVSPSCAE